MLESYPRDELFQIDVDDLVPIAEGIVHLQERRRTRLFLRPDTYGRFVSALVFLPRDRYSTGVRQRIEHELGQSFHTNTIEFDDPAQRIRTGPGVLPHLASLRPPPSPP